jgi:nucleotide-binding universal stress UspA family protein
MTAANISLPVVAGIDGSATALHAALWAVDEAVSRSTPLRLVYVIKPGDRSAAEYAEDVHRGHESLRQASSAIEGTGEPVTIETAMPDGPTTEALLDQSAQARMICVGSVGIDAYARSILGSTAADVAEKARCPVAVIRPELHIGGGGLSWIIVAVDDHPGNAAVLEHALQEAALRGAAVLALGGRRVAGSAEALEDRIRPLRASHPGVHIYPIAGEADVTHFLRRHDEPVLLAVIGADEAGEVAQIVGHGHSLFRHGAASVLVVRP